MRLGWLKNRKLTSQLLFSFRKGKQQRPHVRLEKYKQRLLF